MAGKVSNDSGSKRALPEGTKIAEVDDLVDRARAGDRAAFGLLVERFRPRIYALGLHLTGSRSEADDIAQEAFVHAFERLATCRRPDRFAAWLLAIVQRRSLNRLRTIRRRRLVPLDEQIPSARSDAPVRALERADLRARLLAALGRLAPIQREIVLLADVEHWPHDRIAAATGISVVMSRRHLSDARRRLRDLLSSSND